MGSEPGVGWQMAIHLAKFVNVTVLTRTENRTAIEQYLRSTPVRNLDFQFVDVDGALAKPLRRPSARQVHYLAWQRAAKRRALKLVEAGNYDIAHHLTYARYWMPTAIHELGLPAIWGPVGGGESTPRAFYCGMPVRSQVAEIARVVARHAGELSPRLKSAARSSAVCLASTEETASRLLALGARDVRIASQVGLSKEDFEHLSARRMRTSRKGFRAISVGRLVHWKGFDLGLRAFAMASIPRSEYLIVGDGPMRFSLERLAANLGILDKTRFVGNLSRSEVLGLIAESSALLHPSLHDSGSFVCLEAMAAGVPVICLAVGGPAVIVTHNTGYPIRADSREQVVADMSTCLRNLAGEDAAVESRSDAARERVRTSFLWETKADSIIGIYQEVASRE